MRFDTHTHANFRSFEDEGVIKRSLDSSTWMINVGTTLATSKEVVGLAERYDRGVYAAIGLHPGHVYAEAADPNEAQGPIPPQRFELEAFRALAGSKKVVAVGECGLDYYRLPEDLSERTQAVGNQQAELKKQLDFAMQTGLPVTFHCREAYDDMLKILDAYSGIRGVVHSFTGDWEVAKKFLDRGFLLGINGILTFDKSGRLAEVCRKSPLESLVTETDAPYLAPVPMRGKRNEPAYVSHIVAKIAELRGLNLEAAEEELFRNALGFFRIRPDGAVSPRGVE